MPEAMISPRSIRADLIGQAVGLLELLLVSSMERLLMNNHPCLAGDSTFVTSDRALRLSFGSGDQPPGADTFVLNRVTG